MEIYQRVKSKWPAGPVAQGQSPFDNGPDVPASGGTTGPIAQLVRAFGC